MESLPRIDFVELHDLDRTPAVLRTLHTESIAFIYRLTDAAREYSQPLALALRSAGAGRLSDEETRDVLSFLALCLAELGDSIEETARAWERREYWLKADRFRAEWLWVGRIREELETALRAPDWARAFACGTELASILAERNLRVANSKATPWKGAWNAWVQKH